MEGTAQQVDSGILGWMECVTVNSMWKVLHSRWTVVLWVEWSVLQWKLCGILGTRNFYNHKKIYIFLFWILNWSMSYVLNFSMHKFNCNTSPIAKDTRLFISLLKSHYFFAHTQIMLNSKLPNFSTVYTHTNIRFRKVRTYTNSRILTH